MRVLKGLHPAGADQIGAGIGGALDPQRQEAALGVERQRRFGRLVAGLMVGEKDLAAAGDPLDRAADPPGRPQHQHVLGIDEVLGAKAAADIGRHKPHRGRGHPERAGGMVAGGVDALARHIGGISAVLRVPHADDAARLDRVGDDAVVVEAELDDMRGCGEGRLDRGAVAGSPVEAEIPRRLGRELRRVRGAGGGGVVTAGSGI